MTLLKMCQPNLTFSAKDNKEFIWQWIADRCEPTKNIEDTLRYATCVPGWRTKKSGHYLYI